MEQKQEQKQDFVCEHCGNHFPIEEGEKHQETCLKKYDKMFAVPEGLV